MQTAAPSRKRRKWPFRVLWSFFAVIVGVCLFWTWSYRSALAERDALIAEIRARGEPVWWDEVEQLLAESTEGTGAKGYLRAINAIWGETNNKAPRVPSKQLLDELEMDKYSPQIHPLLGAELKLAVPAIAALESAVQLPPGLIIRRINTTEPIDIILSEVADVRQLAKMLHWESFDALARGDVKRAYHAVWLSMEASSLVTRDPFPLAHFCRFSVLSMAFLQLGMCLSNASIAERESKEIDATLGDLENSLKVRDSICAQRAMLLTSWNDEKFFQYLGILERQRDTNRNSPGFFFHRRWFDVLSTPLGRPILLKTQVEYLKAYDRFAPMIDDSEWSGIEIELKTLEALENVSVLKQAVGNGEWIDVRMFRSLHRRCRTIHRQVVFARLALRLRRYFDQHGRLPEKLDEVCDEAMPKIRLEWFQNQPITYKQSTKGFRLEVPESILPTEERAKVHETPISGDYGLEVEFKTIKPAKGGER